MRHVVIGILPYVRTSILILDGTEMRSPRHVQNRLRWTREGPELACLQTLIDEGGLHAGREGRINVLRWYRRVGAVKTSKEMQGGSTGLPARVSGRHWYGNHSPHLSLPNSQPFGGSKGCARRTGKAGENGQNSGEMGGSSPWTRPSSPGCGVTLKALAGDQRPICFRDRPRRRLRGRYRLGYQLVVLL